MEAACCPEMLVTICWSTLHNNLEDLNLQNGSNVLSLSFPYLFMADITTLPAGSAAVQRQ